MKIREKREEKSVKAIEERKRKRENWRKCVHGRGREGIKRGNGRRKGDSERRERDRER